MKGAWNFASYNFGRRRGFDASHSETFKGKRYLHLVREVCQNSLDAADDKDKPVRVEFKKVKLKKELIPGFKRYKEVFELCDASQDKKNKKAKDFFSYALNLLNREEVTILRVSDFNTTGLTGSKEEKDSNWQNLIKAVGTSSKPGHAGGSFGHGKYAAFACSNLKTVFYDTYDKEGIIAAQGVVDLPNFIDKDGLEKEGEGYFSVGEKNEPINEHLSLDLNFDRGVKVGTDLYIIGFIEKDDWVSEMVFSVVESFLLSIYNNKLEVVIEDVKINKDNLEGIVEEYVVNKYLNKGNAILEFFKVLTSKETTRTTHMLRKPDGNNLGEFELMLLIDKSLTNRSVLMSRSTGMKIFEQKRFPRGLPFSGICILKGEKINEFFRKMETPGHDAWEADRFSEDPNEIKKANDTRLKLIRKIRNELNEMAQVAILDEVDVEGLGRYLPDLNEDFLGTDGVEEGIKKEGSNTHGEIIATEEDEISEKIMNFLLKLDAQGSHSRNHAANVS